MPLGIAENIAEQVKITRVLDKICVRNSLRTLSESTVNDVILDCLKKERRDLGKEHRKFIESICKSSSSDSVRADQHAFSLAIDAMLRLSSVDPQDVIIDKKIMYLVDGPDQVTVEEKIEEDSRENPDKLKWMVDYDINMAIEWLNGIQFEGDKSWYVLPMNQLAKQVIVERQINGRVTKFFSNAKKELCSTKNRAKMGITSALYLGASFYFSLGMDIEQLVKELVKLVKCFHLHMRPINFTNPKSTGKGKRRKTAAGKPVAAADISPNLPNRWHILFGSVQFISIIDFPDPGMDSFSLIGICLHPFVLGDPIDKNPILFFSPIGEGHRSIDVFVLDRRRATLFAVQISITTKSPDHFENSLKYFMDENSGHRLEKWQSYWESVMRKPMEKETDRCPKCHRSGQGSWKELLDENLDFLPKEPQPKLVLVLVYFAPMVEIRKLVRPASIAPWDYALSAPLDDQKCFFEFLESYTP